MQFGRIIRTCEICNFLVQFSLDNSAIDWCNFMWYNADMVKVRQPLSVQTAEGGFLLPETDWRRRVREDGYEETRNRDGSD